MLPDLQKLPSLTCDPGTCCRSLTGCVSLFSLIPLPSFPSNSTFSVAAQCVELGVSSHIFSGCRYTSILIASLVTTQYLTSQCLFYRGCLWVLGLYLTGGPRLLTGLFLYNCFSGFQEHKIIFTYLTNVTIYNHDSS